MKEESIPSYDECILYVTAWFDNSDFKTEFEKKYKKNDFSIAILINGGRYFFVIFTTDLGVQVLPKVVNPLYMTPLTH